MYKRTYLCHHNCIQGSNRYDYWHGGETQVYCQSTPNTNNAGQCNSCIFLMVQQLNICLDTPFWTPSIVPATGG